MNCDRVFDVLTRGPFPTGAASDAAVERHLGHCAECRRLATALRPAVELFEEAIHPEDSRGLPSYWGEVTEPHPAAYDATFATLEEEISIARTTRRALHRARATRSLIPVRAIDDCDRLFRFLGAVAVGVVLAFSFRTMSDGAGEAASSSRSAGMNISGLPWQVCSAAMIVAPQRPGQGASMQASGISSLASLESSQLRCCSKCHHAGSRFAGAAPVPQSVAMSCVACHAERGDEPDEQELMLESHSELENLSDSGA